MTAPQPLLLHRSRVQLLGRVAMSTHRVLLMGVVLMLASSVLAALLQIPRTPLAASIVMPLEWQLALSCRMLTSLLSVRLTRAQGSLGLLSLERMM